LAAKAPQTATLFVIASLAMIGLPMLNGFVGEFLILSSTFSGVSHGWAVVATVGVILNAAYMLWLVQRLFYGQESQMAAANPADDLKFGELALLWPFAVLMLVMGVVPQIWINVIENRIGPPPRTVALRPAVPVPQVQLSIATASPASGAATGVSGRGRP
jgi:NADH-quinone oxidoreductase subunit M